MRGDKRMECDDCERVLPLAQFYLEKNHYSRRKKCNKCRSLKKNYGVTGKEYFKMLEDQMYSCLICEDPINEKTAVVDHSHDDQNVRALLCTNCNIAIGHLDHDQEIAYRAVEYLRKFT
jgi:hypothetical protein